MNYLGDLLKTLPNGLEILATAYIVWFIAHFYFVRLRDLEKSVKNLEEVVFSRAMNANNYIKSEDISNEILEASGIKSAIDKSYEELKTELEKQTLKSKFDIQQKSIWVIARNFDNDEYIEVKDFMFDNPTYKNEALQLDKMIILGGLYLCERYLQINPNKFDKE